MRSQHNTCSPLIFPMGVSKHYGIQRGEVAVDVEDIIKRSDMFILANHILTKKENV